MNKDNKLRRLLAPLIFMVLIFVPWLIFDIPQNIYMQEIPDVIWRICMKILLVPMMLGEAVFSHIPIGVYIVMLIIYTVVSWKWILKWKKGNVTFFIVWIILCILSILMYWKWVTIIDMINSF